MYTWLTEQIYQHYLKDQSCYEITVEAPSDGFQMMKDSLDLKLLLATPEMKDFREALNHPIADAKTIFDFSRKLNKDNLQTLNKSSKLRKAQISRVFDIILLASINSEDSIAVSAYNGFLRKKIERLNSQILFSRVKEKYIEHEGVVVPIHYPSFAPNNPERRLLWLVDKRFDEIFDFTLKQYKVVLASHKKNPHLEELQSITVQ